MTDKPQLSLAVLSDYICPFCYIGYLRLERLREHFELAVNWALVEIHPDSPAEGRPIEELGYSKAHLDGLMGELAGMARDEGIELSPHTFTTNSHKALLLAEASKALGAEVFYHLHRRLFESFLIEGRNIGDSAVLESLAEECAVPRDTLERAWNDPACEQRLQRNLAAAVHNGATGTPTFFIGDKRLTGAVSVDALMAAAHAALAAGESA